MDSENLLERVVALDETVEPAAKKADRPAVDVAAGSLAAVMTKLRDEPDLAFDMLCSHTAVDWLAEERFELVYQLYSTRHRHYLQVGVFVPRKNPLAPTVCPVWPVAEWQEREVYDLFGIRFSGHHNLKRLFLWEGFKGYPLRKDYNNDA